MVKRLDLCAAMNLCDCSWYGEWARWAAEDGLLVELPGALELQESLDWLEEWWFGGGDGDELD